LFEASNGYETPPNNVLFRAAPSVEEDPAIWASNILKWATTYHFLLRIGEGTMKAAPQRFGAPYDAQIVVPKICSEILHLFRELP
jgi:hypothetical protein